MIDVRRGGRFSTTIRVVPWGNYILISSILARGGDFLIQKFEYSIIYYETKLGKGGKCEI